MAQVTGLAGTSAKDTEIRLPRATKIKNKQPANKQITAEQILRESKELQQQDFKQPKQFITNVAELEEYRLRKRKEYEDTVRRKRWDMSAWMQYAAWEESQKDFRRARSVWERTLDVQHTSVIVWLRYAEMEMRHRFVNHARNVWDRAVQLLPRIDQLWYKYIHMEEMLGNVAGARQIFERWMRWEPDHNGWAAYIKMELRYSEVERARAIYERYVACLPSVKAWVRYAKFELQQGEVARARACYERAVRDLGEESNAEELYIKFAEFEEKVKEMERARAIYKFALNHIPKARVQEVYRRFVAFEKQHGDRGSIEEVIVSERRFEYEAEVQANPTNYDAWFDYIRLEEADGDPDRIREVYERAIAHQPPGLEKRYWQRYIYLWINYALWEELEAQDVSRTREVYRACLKLIPHRLFTYAKIWLMAAQLEIRQLNLGSARKILGMAIGMCPKDKLFRAYIELELQLGNMDHCRKLYDKYLQWNPANCKAWGRLAELEASLGEADRARSIYELAISQPVLDMPELLWKAYIDFEIGEGGRERTRALYERLLERTRHVKVWMSFAAFEATPLAQLAPPPPEDPEDPDAAAAAAAREHRRELEAAEAGTAEQRAATARGAYERAFRSLRQGQPDAKEEAVMLLEAWREFERAAGEGRPDAQAKAVEAVERKMPKRVKRKRAIESDGGLEAGMEEYYDYIFPEEAGAAPNLKLLEAAQRWKRQKLEAEAAGGSTDGAS